MLLEIVDRRGFGQDELDKGVFRTGGRLHDFLSPTPEVLTNAIGQFARRWHRAAVLRIDNAPQVDDVTAKTLEQLAMCRCSQVAVQPLEHPWVGMEIHRHPIGLGQIDGGQHTLFPIHCCTALLLANVLLSSCSRFILFLSHIPDSNDERKRGRASLFRYFARQSSHFWLDCSDAMTTSHCHWRLCISRPGPGGRMCGGFPEPPRTTVGTESPTPLFPLKKFFVVHRYLHISP